MQTRVILLIIILFLAACSASPQEEMQPSNVPESSPELVTHTPTVTLTASPPATQSPFPSTTPAPSATPTEVIVLCSPLEIHPLSELPEIIGDGYDPPRPGREERHHGIDFAYYHYQDRDSMLGEPVQSILPGRVASVLTGQYPYGNMVIIETASVDVLPEFVKSIEMNAEQSLYTLYAHMEQPPVVMLADQVEACQPLGVVGMSGNTDIPHLHIETRLGPPGQVFESMRFYDTRATVEEMEAYETWCTSGVYQHFDPLLILAPEAIPTATPDGG